MKYFKREKTECGGYVGADGELYTVLWCHAVHSPKRQTPEELGYEPFESMEAALEAWGLVPYVYPEEEFLTEE